jgi:hypothetical protein
VRPLLPAPLLLALAACSALHTHEIADTIGKDAAALAERHPGRGDIDPARAGNAPEVMAETERRARDYLSRRNDGTTRAAYVRSLLACALLAQGRPAEAREALRWRDAQGHVRETKQRGDVQLTPENVVVACSVHATAVCRSVQARDAAEAFFAGELPAEAFVAEFGSFAGLPVGSEDPAEREKLVKLAALQLEGNCAPGVAEPRPGAQKARGELLRVLSEQAYNDLASLVARMRLPPERDPRPAEEVWLARVAVKSVTIYRYLIPSMLPAPLSAEQKQWQREQALPLFKNARALAGWFLTADARTRIEETRQPATPDEVLYDRLLSAQLEVFAWIDSR